jgi:hypothetical protein
MARRLRAGQDGMALYPGKPMRSYRWLGGLLPLLISAASAQAQAPPAEPTPAIPPPVPAPADNMDKWHFALIGYVWLANAKGTTDVIVPAAPVGLDLNYGDVLDAFKFALMGAAEARKDRLVLFADFTFFHLDTKKGIRIREPDLRSAELDSRTAEVTLLGGYRVVDNAPLSVDLLAGGRLNFLKTTLQLDGPNRSAKGTTTENWFDPMIAARARVPLNEKWSLSFYGDLGGIVTGADLTWQAVAGVDYRINRRTSLGLGWRHFKVDYDKGDFLYDVRQSGPMLTARMEL